MNKDMSRGAATYPVVERTRSGDFSIENIFDVTIRKCDLIPRHLFYTRAKALPSLMDD